MRRLTITILAALFAAVAGPSGAQSLFSPAITVNDTAITLWQIRARADFLRILNAPGDVRALAESQLVESALRRQLAEEAGIEVPEQQVREALDQFAAQANLTPEEFIAGLGQAGVPGETFVDFVTTNVIWRTYAQTVFREAAQEVDQDALNRALAVAELPPGRRVLLTEIILPSGDAATRRASLLRAEELRRISDAREFSAAARRFSVAPSRVRGGELDWQPQELLPEEVRAAVEALSPGRISRPLESETSIALIYMRDEDRYGGGTADAVDYAIVTLPGATAAEARARAAAIRSCDSLYDGAVGGRLQRSTVAVARLPADQRRVIAGLDADEAAALPASAGGQRILVLCQRTRLTEGEVDESLVRRTLANQRLQALAAQALAEARARARIVPPDAG